MPRRLTSLLIASVIACSASAAGAVAPVCPTVMMYDARTMRLAPEHLDRAAEIVGDEAPASARWVQLVPTVHARLRDDLTVDAYGLQRRRDRSWTAADNFEVMSPALAERCGAWIATAIERTVANDLRVAILPHLDPAGGRVVEWRNHYDFRPRETIGGHSYWSLLLEPIADAIVAHATPATRVDLCLSGEMGEALFRYPAEHLRALRDLRERFDASPNTAGVRLGVGLNWSGLAGRVDPAAIDRGSVRRFFAECDFVGYSCYTPVTIPVTAEDFDRATDRFLAELRDLGVDLPEATPLVLTEIGLGGGDPPRDGRPAATPAEVAAEPWAGRGSGGWRPWHDPALRALRRAYHEALCDYLADPSPGRIDRAFFWSEGPWDPQGVLDKLHHDEAIVERVRRHNAGGQQPH